LVVSIQYIKLWEDFDLDFDELFFKWASFFNPPTASDKKKMDDS
jgi:hypothetical protein